MAFDTPLGTPPLGVGEGTAAAPPRPVDPGVLPGG